LISDAGCFISDLSLLFIFIDAQEGFARFGCSIWDIERILRRVFIKIFTASD